MENSVTTMFLEMTSPDQLKPKRSADPRFQVLEAVVKQWQLNRFLYELVGSAWFWKDKLSWSQAQWTEYAESDGLRTFVAYYDGSPAGYFELRTSDGEVEIVYLGLAPKFIGRGLGGPLVSAALEKAWDMHPGRVWLHTASTAHPAALKSYLSCGMALYKTETENDKSVAS